MKASKTTLTFGQVAESTDTADPDHANSKLRPRYTGWSLRIAPWIACVLVGTSVGWAIAQDEQPQRTSQQILDVSQVHGGVIVHYDCGDGQLTDALCRNDSCIVQGLSHDAEQVASVRARLAKRAPSGQVTVRHWQEEYLPYADNTVNLFVADEPQALPISEVMRVLAPLGVACIKRGGVWQKTVKPWPAEMDQWTHWLHGADGNPVARDELVAPPRSLQWIGSPRWPKTHDTAPSLTGLVTAQGRLLYIADLGPIAIDTHKYDFEKWHLCARDAFNGTMLWKRPIEDWGNRAWSGEAWARDGASHSGHGPWISNPRVIHKRLVANGNDAYVTLGFRAPVSRIDAASGDILRTYDGTEFTNEIVFHDGVLFLTVDRAAQRAGNVGPRPAKSVMAIDPESGRTLWECKGFHGIVDGKFRASDATLTRLSLTVGCGKVFVHDRDAVIALDVKDGTESWRVPVEMVELDGTRPYVATDTVSDLLVSDGVLYSYRQLANRGLPYPIELLALSSDDGSLLWKKQCGAAGFRTMVSIYKARGLLWVLAPPNNKPKTARTYQLWGLDPRSGEVKNTHDVTPVMTSLHHHRCYRNKATENFVIFSRNGLEFADLRSGKVDNNRWVRGICSYGIMPANGLVYTPPQQCICFASARMSGFAAYRGSSSTEEVRTIPDDKRLKKGRAYGKCGSRNAENDNDWPMYRHDGSRSASTDAKPGSQLKESWGADLGEPTTATTVGWGKVFLAGLHTHRVIALDSRDGQVAWSADVDNRVDTPPTLWQRKVYCGTAGGYVYCLRADDGELVWRFNANPAHRSIVAFGNIESAWPVHGSVTINDGAVYFAAGRTTYLDGGLRFYALDAETGQPRHCEMRSTAGEGSNEPGADVQGTLNDLFVCDGTSLFMKNLRLDPETFHFEAASWPYTPWTKQPWEQDFKESPLGSITGFLDDSLYDRSSFILDQRHSARLLAFNDDLLVGVRWATDNMVSGRLLFHEGFYEIGRNQYTVFAKQRAASTNSVRKPRPAANTELWSRRVPIRVEALSLAGDAVYVTGPPMSRNGESSPDFVLKSLRGENGGVLMRLSLRDGAAVKICDLPTRPVWEGIAITDHGLFVALRDGKTIKLDDVEVK